MAINKQAIVDAVFQGAATVAKNPIPPTMWSYNNAIEDDKYDPAAAKAALEAAGVKDLSMKVWAMPVARPYMLNARRAAELIQSDFAAVGVKVEIVSYEWAEYLEAVEGQGPRRRGHARLDRRQRRSGQLPAHPARLRRRRRQQPRPVVQRGVRQDLSEAAKVTVRPGRAHQALRGGAGRLQARGAVGHARPRLVVMPMSAKVSGYVMSPLGHHLRSAASTSPSNGRRPSAKGGRPPAGRPPLHIAAGDGLAVERLDMLRFLLGRLAVLIPTFIGVSIIAFSFIRLLPGDPVMLMSGERVMSEERCQQISHELGYDRPIVVQYLDYLWGVVRGDFGTSVVTKQPILDQFFTLFPATLELSLCAIIFAVGLGIPAGIFAAIKRGSFSTRRSWARR
jgi:hypothetical protein